MLVTNAEVENTEDNYRLILRRRMIKSHWPIDGNTSIGLHWPLPCALRSTTHYGLTISGRHHICCMRTRWRWDRRWHCRRSVWSGSSWGNWRWRNKIHTYVRWGGRSRQRIIYHGQRTNKKTYNKDQQNYSGVQMKEQNSQCGNYRIFSVTYIRPEIIVGECKRPKNCHFLHF